MPIPIKDQNGNIIGYDYGTGGAPVSGGLQKGPSGRGEESFTPTHYIIPTEEAGNALQEAHDAFDDRTRGRTHTAKSAEPAVSIAHRTSARLGRNHAKLRVEHAHLTHAPEETKRNRIEQRIEAGTATEGEIKQEQRVLQKSGDYHGNIDGVWGAKSQKALQTARNARHLKPMQP